MVKCNVPFINCLEYKRSKGVEAKVLQLFLVVPRLVFFRKRLVKGFLIFLFVRFDTTGAVFSVFPAFLEGIRNCNV